MKKPKNLGQKLVKNPQNPTSAFRQNVGILMDMNGFTLNETAEKSNIPFETFKAFFYGKSDECRLSTAVKMARIFDMSIDEIVGAETITSDMEDYIKMYKAIPEYAQYLIKYFIRHQYNIYQKREIYGKKVISIIKPRCVDGYLQFTNEIDQICIEHLEPSIKTKVRLGLKIPCEHYMPIYSPYDTLLISADRDAMHGEKCLIERNSKLFLVEKRIYIKDGVKRNEYVSLMNNRFRISDVEIDEMIGYVVGFLNSDGTWGVK